MESSLLIPRASIVLDDIWTMKTSYPPSSVSAACQRSGIDLVLQGHDHVCVLVLAKSASGQVVPLPERPKLSSESFDGEKIDFAVNPPGTTYIIPNVSGSQFGSRKISSTVQVYPEAVYEPDDNDEPVFAEIKIDGNRLVYRAYAYDREGDGMVKEIDRYAILKEQKTDVWQPAVDKSQSGRWQLQSGSKNQGSSGKVFGFCRHISAASKEACSWQQRNPGIFWC